MLSRAEDHGPFCMSVAVFDVSSRIYHEISVLLVPVAVSQPRSCERLKRRALRLNDSKYLFGRVVAVHFQREKRTLVVACISLRNLRPPCHQRLSQNDQK